MTEDRIYMGDNGMQQGLDEWLVLDEQNMKFHMEQYRTPYRSTIKFAEFLQQKDIGGKVVEFWMWDAVQELC